MMIFDHKEEVYDIQLTDHGKRLLAEGKFDPKYYSFSDESIIYDSNYTGISTEPTTKVEKRILEDTVYIKPIINVSGINEKNTVKIMSDLERDYYKKITSLGTSDNTTDYYPSWDVRIAEADISSSQPFINKEQKGIKIPQLELEDLDYNFNVLTDIPRVLIQQAVNFGVPSIFEGEEVEEFEDIYEVEDRNLFLEIDEENSFLKNNKFSLEVFIFEDKDNDVLRKLKFASAQPEDTNIFTPDENEEIELDNSFVEHYFDITTDQDIDPKIICENVSEQRRKGVYAKNKYDCETRFIDLDREIYEDLRDNLTERCDD